MVVDGRGLACVSHVGPVVWEVSGCGLWEESWKGCVRVHGAIARGQYLPICCRVRRTWWLRDRGRCAMEGRDSAGSPWRAKKTVLVRWSGDRREQYRRMEFGY